MARREFNFFAIALALHRLQRMRAAAATIGIVFRHAPESNDSSAPAYA